MNLFLYVFVYWPMHAIVKWLFYWLFVVGEKNISGSGSKFNCAAQVGSDDLGYGLQF